MGATMCYMDTRKQLDIRLVGQRVAARRTALRLEQTELAEHAGLSRAYISRLESGIVQNPKVLDLERVAGALDVPLATLVSPDRAVREIHITTCADILGQLADEPPEVTDTILRWLRESVSLATRHPRQN